MTHNTGYVTRGNFFEDSYHNYKEWPCHKYVTRPIYKACVKQVGPVFATAIAFLVADLLLHQFVGRLLGCTVSYLNGRLQGCPMHWDYRATFFWMVIIAGPVMYAKYRRYQNISQHAR